MSELLRSPKLRAWHLDRQAIVYVRQSTPQQVLDHQESTARQYALVDRAATLGWTRDRVTTIDDLGRSGQSIEGRPGFQRLLAEVALDHVGLILGLEMSRLARSCKDWHQLLELCGRYRVLLADADGIYDPTEHSDRLLLGLHGVMNEAELHVLKARMYQGKLNKARRGESLGLPPIGYLRVPTGEWVIDPDEQVQAVVRLIFDQFDRGATMHGLLRYLVHHQVRVPVRLAGGPNKGQLEWRRPNRATLQNLLRHPSYAGAYRFGHRPVDPRKKQPGRPNTGKLIRRPEECLVLIRDRLPAYITWERFEANQARLTANRNLPGTPGAPRNGPAVLAGLVRCGRCGRRMVVRRQRHGSSAGLGADEYRPMSLARRLGISRDTVRRWLRAGWLNLRRDEDGHHVIWADADERGRLGELHALTAFDLLKYRGTNVRPRPPAGAARDSGRRLPAGRQPAPRPGRDPHRGEGPRPRTGTRRRQRGDRVEAARRTVRAGETGPALAEEEAGDRGGGGRERVQTRHGGSLQKTDLLAVTISGDASRTQRVRGSRRMARERRDADRRSRQCAKFARLIRIARLVMGNGRWGPEDLAREIECSQRTIFRDVEALTAAGIPIFFDKSVQAYRLPPGFRFSGVEPEMVEPGDACSPAVHEPRNPPLAVEAGSKDSFGEREFRSPQFQLEVIPEPVPLLEDVRSVNESEQLFIVHDAPPSGRSAKEQLDTARRDRVRPSWPSRRVADPVKRSGPDT